MHARIALTLLLAGLAALDATPAAQTLLSQPLIMASLLGTVWGDWRTALEVGIVLQILSASTMPVGSRTPEDYAVGGVVGIGLALVLAGERPFEMTREAAAFIGCAAGMITATAGVPLIKWQRRQNEGLSRWVEEELRGGRLGALASAHRAALAFAFAAGAGLAAIALGAGVALCGPLVTRESMRLARAWSLAQPLWLGLGLAQLLHAFVQRRLARAALFGVCLLGTWLLLLVSTP